MKRLWQQYTSKIEAASLRERVMIFAGAAVLLIVLLNTVLIEPELVKQRRLSKEVAGTQGDIGKMQEQLQALALARQADPDQVNRRQLESLRRQVAEAETKLTEEQRKFAPPERIGALLEEMLSRNRRLQLVDMRTLPAVALSPGGAAQKPAAPSAGAPDLPPWRGNHGLRHLSRPAGLSARPPKSCRTRCTGASSISASRRTRK